jgi:signal transduction histidine kinase
LILKTILSLHQTTFIRLFFVLWSFFIASTFSFGQEIVFDEVVTRGVFTGIKKSYKSPKSIQISTDEDFLFCYFHVNKLDSVGLKVFFTLDSATWNQEIALGQPFFISHLPTGVRTIVNVRAQDSAGKLVATNYLPIYVDSPIWTKWWVHLLLFTFILGIISLIVFFYLQQNIRQIRQTFQLREKMHNDLHDEMGTSLGSINLLVNHLKKKIAPISTDETSGLFAEIETQIKATHEEMRDLMWAIKPTNNKASSVVKAINAACTALLIPANIGFQVNETGDLANFSLQLDQNYQLVRLLKEALYNVVKHAKADFVDISVGLSEQRFYLIIEDNGVGFDVDLPQNGTGLRSFQNRATTLNGAFLIESVAGEGTTITLSFPVFRA